MKAVRLSRFGEPEVLDIVEIPTPLPTPGEVLVRIRAAGVNFFETLVRRGLYPGAELTVVPGVEAVGEVAGLGDGVDPALLGRRVAVPLFAIGRGSGGYAEFVAVEAAAAVPVPDGLSDADAVALLVQGLTVLHLVRQGPPRGRTVLVMAAAGGVGSLLLQLAKRAGATRVIAAAGSAGKLDIARSLGADAAVDTSRPGWADRVREATDGAGVELVYETVGGEMTAAALPALAPRGELVFAALNRFALPAAAIEGMAQQNQSLRGFALLPLLDPATLRDSLAELFGLAVDGALTVLPAMRYPLDRAAAAHRALEGRRTAGKVILEP